MNYTVVDHNKMNDTEFYMLVDCMNSYFDGLVSEETLNPYDALFNLHCLECYLTGMTDEAVADIIATEEGLESFVGHPQELLAQVQKDIATQEGLLDEWLGDGPIKAFFGRKMKTAEYLDPALIECEKKLGEIKETGKITEGVSSRYLPTVKSFNARAKVILDVAKVIKGISNLSSFDPNSIMQVLKGTPYWNATKQQTKGQQDTDFAHILIMNLDRLLFWVGAWLARGKGIVADAGRGMMIGEIIGGNIFFEQYKPTAWINTRGWKTKDDLLAGVKTAKELVAAMKTITDKCKSLLQNASTEDKKKAKEVMALGTWITTEAGLLGRGIVTAVKKVNSGIFSSIAKSIAYA